MNSHYVQYARSSLRQETKVGLRFLAMLSRFCLIYYPVFIVGMAFFSLYAAPTPFYPIVLHPEQVSEDAWPVAPIMKNLFYLSVVALAGLGPLMLAVAASATVTCALFCYLVNIFVAFALGNSPLDKRILSMSQELEKENDVSRLVFGPPGRVVFLGVAIVLFCSKIKMEAIVFSIPWIILGMVTLSLLHTAIIYTRRLYSVPIVEKYTTRELLFGRRASTFHGLECVKLPILICIFTTVFAVCWSLWFTAYAYGLESQVSSRIKRPFNQLVEENKIEGHVSDLVGDLVGEIEEGVFQIRPAINQTMDIAKDKVLRACYRGAFLAFLGTFAFCVCLPMFVCLERTSVLLTIVRVALSSMAIYWLNRICVYAYPKVAQYVNNVFEFMFVIYLNYILPKGWRSVISAEELSKLTGERTDRLNELATQGQIPCLHVNGSVLFVREDALRSLRALGPDKDEAER